ncbi:MAG: aspartate aminotransferase family protein [Hyphomicrobiaceae bacterium]
MTNTASRFQKDNRSLDAYWMPFTPNRQFKADPRILVGAKGVYYESDDGRSILDGTGGLWCCNAGHGHQEIADAVHRQLISLDYAPSFNISHDSAFDFAERLTALAPENINHVFFTNSGSESVDTALKIALAYHKAKGDAGRTRLIGRERAYHGVGFGGIAVGGIVSNRRQYGALIAGVDHIRHTHDLEHNAFSKGQPAWGAHLADDLERMVALHGADTIAAVIVEPVACATGVLIPPQGYLQRLRDICDRHGILLIFDEVVTAFGRLGTAFAADYFDVIPDLICTAKGLTNGVMPMGAVFAQSHVYDAVTNEPKDGIELFHGYTYSGHPTACAAGLATLNIYEREGIFQNAAELAPHFESALHSLKSVSNVKDIRNLGLVGAVELDSRSGTPGQLGFDVYKACYETGVLVRPIGDIIALSPPLTISESEIDQMISLLGTAIKNVS